MKILVCIKRVPDTTTKIKIHSDGKRIDPSGVKFVLNPYDEIAVEKAIQIKEAKGEGEVIVLSLGPAAAATEIRTALAMGADRGILLRSEDADWDAHSVATALAEAIRGESPDLVLLGRQAVDDDEMQVGGRVAEILGLPSVHMAGQMELGDGKMTLRREIEGGFETLECSLPAVVTAQKSLAEPRYPSLKGIMAAKKKPIDEREAANPGSKIEILAMELPPERPPGRIVGEGAEAVAKLVELLHGEAKVI
jgi:electron transfer flavoprotein beta subunit